MEEKPSSEPMSTERLHGIAFKLLVYIFANFGEPGKGPVAFSENLSQVVKELSTEGEPVREDELWDVYTAVRDHAIQMARPSTRKRMGFRFGDREE